MLRFDDISIDVSVDSAHPPRTLFLSKTWKKGAKEAWWKRFGRMGMDDKEKVQRKQNTRSFLGTRRMTPIYEPGRIYVFSSLSLSLSLSLSVCLFHDSQSRVSSRVNRQASKCRTRFQVLVQKSAPCQSIPVWTFAFYAYQWFTALCIIRSLLAILQMGHLIRWISPVNRKQVNILK